MICAAVLSLETVERLDRDRLVHEPGQQDRAYDHDVARDHQDHDPARDDSIDAERDVDRNDQHLVGERIEIGAELGGHAEALGEEAVDRIADGGHHEQQERNAHLAGRDRPHDDGHQQNAPKRNQIWNTQSAAPTAASLGRAPMVASGAPHDPRLL